MCKHSQSEPNLYQEGMPVNKYFTENAYTRSSKSDAPSNTVNDASTAHFRRALVKLLTTRCATGEVFWVEGKKVLTPSEARVD